MKSGANHHPKIDELADAPGKDFKGGWGKLPQKWFADGFLPKLNLKRNQLYVLLVIVAHLDGRTLTCGTLSTGDIAVRAGIRSRRTVHAAIKNLTAKKLITIEQRHGRGNHNIFRISESAQVPGHNCSLQAVKCANSPRNTRRKCANPGGHQGEVSKIPA